MTNMAEFYRYFLSLLIVLLAVLNTVKCLNCVRCSSIFDRRCISGDVAPEPCSNDDQKYCMKYEGIIDSKKVVFRDCDITDHETECSMKTIENQPVKVCYNTCSTDGCNHAPLMSRDLSVLVVALLASVVLVPTIVL